MKYIIAPVLFLFSMYTHAAVTCVALNNGATVVWQYQHGNIKQVDGSGPLPLDYGPKFCVVDGPELTYVQANFTGLHGVSKHTNPYQTDTVYSGSDAEFINQNI